MSCSESSESSESFADESPPPTSAIAGGNLRLPVTPAPQKNVNQRQMTSEMMHEKHEEALREQRVSIERLEQALLFQQQQHMHEEHRKHEEALREQRVSIERLEQALLVQQQQHKKSIDEIKSKTNDVIGSLRNQISVLKKNCKTTMSEVATLKKDTAKKEPPANSASAPTPASSWGLSTFLGASNKDDNLKKLASKCAKQMQNFHTRLQVVEFTHRGFAPILH